MWLFGYRILSPDSNYARKELETCSRTLTWRTQIFVQHWHCAYTSHILKRVTHMHGSRVSAVRMSSSLCHLTFSLLMFHPSLLLLFFDGHDFLPNFPDLNELFGYLAKSSLNTGYEPKKFDKNTSVDDDATLINDPDHNFWDFSKTMNENTRQFGVHTVFESSVLHFFALVILFLREKVKKACNRETVAWQRETEEREGFATSVAKSMSMKSRRNSIRSHSFPTHKEFYSDERDLRGHLEWRAQHAILGEKSIHR